MSQTLRSQTWIYLHKGPLIRIPLKIYSHFLIELPINPTFPACQIPSHLANHLGSCHVYICRFDQLTYKQFESKWSNQFG